MHQLAGTHIVTVHSLRQFIIWVWFGNGLTTWYYCVYVHGLWFVPPNVKLWCVIYCNWMSRNKVGHSVELYIVWAYWILINKASICCHQSWLFLCQYTKRNIWDIQPLDHVTDQWWRSRDLILWVSVSSRSRLSKVSVSRFKGLGLAQDYSIETTRLKKKQLKIETWKRTRSPVYSNIPSENMMFFV